MSRADDRARRKRERRGLGALLSHNHALRSACADDPTLGARRQALHAWQARRMARTHRELLNTPRYRAAAKFFLQEMYGGGDPEARDRDFARVQRAMEALLPADALHTLTLAVELDILSQELDIAMVRALPAAAITERSYAEAFRRVGRRADRQRQIEMVQECGEYLDRLVRLPMVHALVRLTRGAAHAAGLGTLQEFLERGLDAFEGMRGAKEFLADIERRERALLQRLFDGEADPFQSDP